ncbi:TraQ conjugal transfer family protein [Alistipes onderdonkii]|uniref:TraQ conjugal transfer family protein n=1 Tax=Alistipes onderdonkii TaxID=328813 RepID=UPI0036F35317
MFLQILMMKVLISCGVAAVFAALFCLYGCNDGIDVRQEYDFSVSTWHLPAAVGPGEEVEIRFTIRSSGQFAGAFYRIAYVQIEGEGEVYDTEGAPLRPQEFRGITSLPELDARDPQKQLFTLYYKSLGADADRIQFIVQDNFGQERTLEVSFSSEEDDTQAARTD